MTQGTCLRQLKHIIKKWMRWRNWTFSFLDIVVFQQLGVKFRTAKCRFTGQHQGAEAAIELLIFFFKADNQVVVMMIYLYTICTNLELHSIILVCLCRIQCDYFSSIFRDTKKDLQSFWWIRIILDIVTKNCWDPSSQAKRQREQQPGFLKLNHRVSQWLFHTTFHWRSADVFVGTRFGYSKKSELNHEFTEPNIEMVQVSPWQRHFSVVSPTLCRWSKRECLLCEDLGVPENILKPRIGVDNSRWLMVDLETVLKNLAVAQAGGYFPFLAAVAFLWTAYMLDLLACGI